ncbi:hypothetical protein NTJ56_26890 [Burkholderia contaminans]|nr:hypothetical protein [Burkholderia contaminans]MCA7913855.1 hypothetical protein [Burkholderia contaminans]MCA8102001.1 hypothetical protein [Burkholderia contaminans]UUX39337.1 hypothetical protein NTJ56_26890 [Burkholderia contaminans]
MEARVVAHEPLSALVLARAVLRDAKVLGESWVGDQKHQYRKRQFT